MESLARHYFWWPNLDTNIEMFVKSYDAYRRNASSPNKAVLFKFQESKEVLERVHMDFLGPFKGKMYLIIIDSFSKWPEVYEMGKIDASSTVDKLRQYCVRCGLPKKIFSDNGRQFTAAEFQSFCQVNGIKHATSAPFHPSSNGAAENAVRSFKNGIKKEFDDPKNVNCSMTTLMSRYLLMYRTTLHCSTGETPTKLMFNRKLRTRSDLINSSAREDKRDSQVKK